MESKMYKIKMCDFLIKTNDSVKIYIEKHLIQILLHYNRGI